MTAPKSRLARAQRQPAERITNGSLGASARIPGLSTEWLNSADSGRSPGRDLGTARFDPHFGPSRPEGHQRRPLPRLISTSTSIGPPLGRPVFLRERRAASPRAAPLALAGGSAAVFRRLIGDDGRFHPANAMTVHELVRNSSLGVLREGGSLSS